MIKRKQAERLNEKSNTYIRASGRNATRKTAIGKTGGRKLYVAGAAGLVLLLLFSFFVPQLIFSLRDSYLCRDIIHEEQEDTDVILMGAAYESSLEQRLKNFVEGKERGRNFYVSAQEMEVTEELYQQLRGTTGILYQQITLRAMMEIGMVSYVFLGDNTFTVNCWKQYVIYSDEYTEGVNFIIWYLDLEAEDGKQLELLIDAEDATIYALCAERNIMLTMTQSLKWDVLDIMSILNLEELWYFLNYCYQSVSREEWNNEALYGSGDGQPHLDVDSDHDGIVTFEMLESAWESGEALSLPDAKTIIMHLLFSTQTLDFSLRLLRSPSQNNSSDQFPVLYMGFDSISELIPEFAERF